MKKVFIALFSLLSFAVYSQNGDKQTLFFQWVKNPSNHGYLDQVLKTKNEVETERAKSQNTSKLKIYEIDKYSYQITNGKITDERVLNEITKYDINGNITFLDNINDNFDGVYFYYKNNLLAEKQKFNKGGGYNSTEYVYNNLGLPISDKLYGGDLQSEYKYDEKNRLVSFKRSLKGLAKAKKQVYCGEYFEFTYSYDDNDKPIKQKFENEFFTTVTDFKYNSNNNLEQEKIYYSYYSPVYNDNLDIYDIAYYEPESYYTIYKNYYYNNKNELDSLVYTSNEKIDIPHSISYKRDLKGNIIAETIRNARGQIVRFYKYEYIRKMTTAEMITEQVQERLNEWQVKGKYESLKDYQIRVSEENRNKQAKLFAQEAINNLANKTYKISPKQMDYDADNEIFKIGIDGLDPIFVNVPRTEAELFEQNKNKLTFEPQYTLVNDKIVLLSCQIKNPITNKVYSYDSKQEIAFNSLKLNLNFEDIKIDVSNQDQADNHKVKENVQTINLGQTDVDINIPVNEQNNDKTFIVVIANENYQKEVPVKYATNDGKIFKEYCEKTLGIPSQNIHLSIDATYGNMKSELKWISDVIKAYNGEAKVIFYYAGHGMPNEQTKSAYLLPVDGFSSDFETAIKLDELYKRLTEYPSKNVTIFLDACFSGSQRDNGMLAEARGVKIKPKHDALAGKTIVFSAASGDETAYPLSSKRHGLFTYFLLKKIQETKGNITLGDLFDYIRTNVNQQSIVVNQKSQTPQVNMGSDIKDSWVNQNLK